jgi:ATP-dependent Clp protease protease subunit
MLVISISEEIDFMRIRRKTMKDSFIKVNECPTIYEKMYNELLDDRIIYLNNDIDENTVDMVTMQIIIANKREKDLPEDKLKPITIYLNSYGGSADVCLHAIEVIEKSRIPIHARVLSVAASAGLYMLLACKYREAYKNTVFLLHKGSIQLSGNMGEAEEIMDFYKGEVQNILDDLVTRRTKITPEQLKKIRRSETYCLGKDALETYGFIDEII